MGRGLLALSLAALASAQEPATPRNAELSEAIRRIDEELPAERWLEAGLPALERALEHAPTTDPNYAWGLKLEAEILLEADLYEGVFELCERARALNAEQLERIHAAGGDREEELQAHHDAVQIAHQRGDLWRRLGLIDRVDETVEEMRAHLGELGRLAGGGPQTVEATFYAAFDATLQRLARGQTEKALENCRSLRERCLPPELPESAARAREIDLLEATALHNRTFEGRLELAEPARRALIALVDSRSAEARIVHDALLLLADLELHTRRWDDARIHLRRLRELGEAREAAPLENAARLCALEGRLALETGAERATLLARRDALRTQIEAILEHWRALPPPPDGLGVLLWGTQRGSLATLFDLELRLDPGVPGWQRALEWLLRVQEVGTLARRMHCPPASVTEVCARLLDEDTACLIWFPSPERTHLFVLTRDGPCEPLILPAQDALWVRIDSWLDQVNAPDSSGDTLARTGAALRAELLPASVEARIGARRRLYVLGTEHLRKLPLGLLPLEDGTPLGVRHALSSLPSLPVALELARREQSAPGSLVLVGAPASADSARERWPEAIEFTLEEEQVRALCAGLPPERSPRFLAAQAWLSPEVRRALGEAALGLFLCHAVWDERARRPLALLFAPGSGGDGRVDCEALEALERVPDLIELAGCNTDRGRVRFGDDSNSLLVPSLLLRGASCVLTTRADVRLQPTVELLAAVNARIVREGMPPAEALRAEREARWLDPRRRGELETARVLVTGLGFRRLPFEAERAGRSRASEPGPGSVPRAGLAWSSALAIALSLAALGVVVLGAVVRRRRAPTGRVDQ